MEFVVIGGLALVLHGATASTQDVDVAIRRDQENVDRLVRALKPFDPRPADYPPELPFIWDAQTVRNLSFMTLTTSLGRLDILTEPPGVSSYQQLKVGAIQVEVRGTTWSVASIDDLIAMKLAVGRPKDLLHIAELRSIQAETP
ncbi:MAG: DUF6036 family nucleotidyltransferase [Fimbriimonadaceae bacterium]|nr:DUF6036 family nucleotidyltransferase [Fimbriimonadaceae bacterium]